MSTANLLEWLCAIVLVGVLVYTRIILHRARRRLVLEMLRRFEVRTTGLDLVQSSGGTLHRGVVHIYLSDLVDEGLVERTLCLGRAWYRARKPDELGKE